MDKNKAMPVITCIMFTYNHFDRIYESLDSVFAQDYPNIELGVFDDCSKNFPAQKIKDYINERKKSNIIKVKVVQNEVNLGTVKNINNAERQFEGKYIINLSPEDPFASSDVMRKIVDKMEELNSEVITTYRIIVDGNGKTVGKSPSERYFNKFIGMTAKEQFRAIATGAGIAGPGTYYSRKYLEEQGFFDENYRLQEDGPMLLKTTRNGHHIDGLNIVSCYYRLGNGVSSSTNLNELLLKDIKRMFDVEVLPFLDQFNFWEKRRIRYEISRLKISRRSMSITQKILFGLKYPDVVLFRKSIR